MSKKQIVLIVIIAIILSWLFNIFPGRLLAAKISTWPLLNRWKILSPQAPIVINSHETVRVSDSGDVLLAATAVKSKVSALVKVKDGEAAVFGGAINLTSDGSFVTGFNSQTAEAYFVLLNDGRMAKADEKVLDEATGLLFFKAPLSGVPTASLARSKDLVPGDKIIFIKNSMQNYLSEISVSWVSASQKQIVGQTFKSDYPRRSFILDSSNLSMGEVLVNTSGEVAGVWNGREVISSDVLKNSMSLYLAHQNTENITRPQFGFSYFPVTQNYAKLTGTPEGAKVIEAAVAIKAGLAAGDIITAVDDSKISENNSLEEILEKYKPGDKVNLTVMRDSKNLNLILTAGELK